MHYNSAARPEYRTGRTTNRLASLICRKGGYAAVFIVINPVLVGTILVVLAVGYAVTGNALHQKIHPSPLFPTRSLPAPGSNRSAGESADPASGGANAAQRAPAETGNSELARIQSVLADLDLYEGAIDGVEGPRTSNAIMRYQQILGLPETGKVDNALRASLGNVVGEASAETLGPPMPKPAPGFYGEDATDDTIATGSVGTDPVMAVQQALVRFGFNELSVDGVMGQETSDALSTFQRIEQLPQTGKADEATLDKLRQRGFLN